MKRREFLRAAGAASAVSLAKGALAAPGKGVAVIVDTRVEVLQSPSVRWAAEQLRSAIAAKGVLCRIVDPRDQIHGYGFCVEFNYGTQNAPDGFRVIAENVSALHVPGLLIAAGNERGFIYALLELAERVRYGRDPMTALHAARNLSEATPNEIRCVSRYFCSESKISCGCMTGISGRGTWTCWPLADSTVSASGLVWSTTFPRT